LRSAGLRARVLILAVLLAGMFVGLAGRLAYLQLYRHAELSQMAERQYSRTVVLPARRGPILDRHGAALATSTPAESLFAQPRFVGDPVRVSARLAPLLNLSERDLHATLTSSRPFVWLRRKLPPAQAAAVAALREPGLGFIPEPMRLYPNRELAAHVLGFEGADGGLEGVERALNAELAGAAGKAVVGRDALGRDAGVQRVLQSLLAEQVSIRDLPVILDALAEAAAFTRDPLTLAARVRIRLARQICQSLAADDGYLDIVTLSPQWQRVLTESIVVEGDNRQLAMAPGEIQRFIGAIRTALQSQAQAGRSPALLVGAEVRPLVRSIVARFSAKTPIISHDEIHPKARIRTLAEVSHDLQQAA